MARASVSVIIYITIAVLILLLISHSPKKGGNQRHRRLKLRSNFTFAPPLHHHNPIPFDPLVADIERRLEDRKWEQQHFDLNDSAPAAESQPEWEDFMNAEDYLNDEERFNVTNRLLLLFPKVDVDPADGFITEEELTQWNLKQAQREVLHRTQRDMELHDKNRDGFVSFAEYQPPSWVQNADNNSFGYDMADSENPKLLQWLCKEEVRERDTDKDEKINFKEFFHGLFDLVRNYEEENHNSSHQFDDSMEAPARNLFAQLDKDGDGVTSYYWKDTSIRTLLCKTTSRLHHIQADTDKDGRLTLTEMIENPYVFYSAIFNDDEEEDYEFHDEFR
ncbi:calumenin [Prunus yedoensis var. nudiflora]|uniref:Calumenin n=1 Tax=Prunus yedoensis var. nudiflora TaxID=2094558 RepID=A0A314XZI3_PRUYE|nr:calumenin [Prunus yedoensis var. nudiflora]